jgi:hypothetical protein
MTRHYIIIIIIIKSSFNRDNNYCHYVIQRIAGFAITLAITSCNIATNYHASDDISSFSSLCITRHNIFLFAWPQHKKLSSRELGIVYLSQCFVSLHSRQQHNYFQFVS